MLRHYKTKALIIIIFMFHGCSGLKENIPFLNQTAKEKTTTEKTKREEPVGKKEKRKSEQKTKEKDIENTYVADEMSFEIKKLKAELKHAKTEIRELQARSEVWTNPLSIYNKEIILKGGSTIFGKIVYQDKEIIKAETLIGYITVNRESVVRIIENVAETPTEKIDNEITEKIDIETQRGSGIDFIDNKKGKEGPNIILLGSVNEFKDSPGNYILSGEVKNIGNKRADFVKINFIFRKDWKGETETLTVFVKGSSHQFETGIATDSSILPGAVAGFELIIPEAFGNFIGYSYSLDWESF